MLSALEQKTMSHVQNNAAVTCSLQSRYAVTW